MNAPARVTRDVDPSALRDLIDDPPRATVAFVDHDAISLLPARAQLGGAQPMFAVRVDGGTDLADREVVLVIDDGPYWFDLRGVSLRGTALRADPPRGERGGALRWYAILPRRETAWDYGALREA